MHRPFTHVLFLALTITTISPALAGDAITNEANSGTNIFSTPETADVVPEYMQVRGDKQAAARKLLLGNTKDDIPNLRQVLNLPSLTPVQKRNLRQAMKTHKTASGELLEKLKSMRQQGDTAGGGATQKQRRNPQEFLALRSQIQDLRRKAWEDVKQQLTPQQLQELEAMRKGELTPATFRTANDGAMMRQ